MQANAARLAFGRRCYRLRSPSARQEGDFSLPEPVNGVIMAPKLTESGECRIRCLLGVKERYFTVGHGKPR